MREKERENSTLENGKI